MKSLYLIFEVVHVLILNVYCMHERNEYLSRASAGELLDPDLECPHTSEATATEADLERCRQGEAGVDWSSSSVPISVVMNVCMFEYVCMQCAFVPTIK